MSPNVRVALIGIFGAVAAFGVFGGFSNIGRRGSSDPADAIPKGSFMAATVDFAELRQSPLFDALLGHDANDPLKKAMGVKALADACGFDPLTRVEKLAVAVPEDGNERGTFGVAARVQVSRDELEKCTTSLAAKRGGKPETKEVGSFAVLDDLAIGGSFAPRLAYGSGGLLVVGKGAWFDAMLDAADHRAPSMKNGSDHATLRQALTSRDGFHAPTILFTAILPKSVREQIKADMADEPSAADPNGVTMGGVLGVSMVGVALHLGASGQNVDAEIELVCDTQEACAAVEKLAQKKKREWASELTLRMIGLGPLLDSFQITRDEKEGLRVRATASMPADALAATIERITKLRQGRGSMPGAGNGPSRRMPKPEIIPARP